MKTKKLGLITVIVLSTVFIFALNASAGWYTCTVTMVGPGGGVNYIQMTDTASPAAFESRWFIANSARSEEMLATALTAISNNMNVTVNISGTVRFSYIYNIYIRP